MLANLLSSLLLVLVSYAAISSSMPYFGGETVLLTPLNHHNYGMRILPAESPNLLREQPLLLGDEKPAAKVIVTYENSPDEFKTIFYSVPAKADA